MRMTLFFNRLVAAVAFTLLCSGAAHAQLYVGASVGLTDTSDGSTSNASRLHAGYRLLDFFALEIGAVEFGKIDKEDEPGSIEADGYEYSLVAFLPFTDNDEVYVRVGQIAWEADEDNGVYDSTRQVIADDGEDFAYSLGYARSILEQGAVRAEISRYEVGDLDINTITVGLEARF